MDRIIDRMMTKRESHDKALGKSIKAKTAVFSVDLNPRPFVPKFGCGADEGVKLPPPPAPVQMPMNLVHNMFRQGCGGCMR